MPYTIYILEPLLSIFISLTHLEKVLIKPLHGLEESLLLGKLLPLVAQISAHSKSMLYVREQVDLERQASANQNLFRLVALFGGEDAVGLSSGNGERTGDGLELFVLDERGVSDVTDVDASLVVADNVLRLLAICL
jgi:hypothetical protein